MAPPRRCIRATAACALVALTLPHLPATPTCAATPPDLAIELGTANRGSGLSVPSAGDGQNEALSAGGSPARRIADGSLYLYVRVDHPDYAPGPRDLYATIEVYDAAPGLIAVHYDRAAPQPDARSHYADAGEPVPLVGSNRWLRLVFSLPATRLGHGQNHGADFRVAGAGLVIRRISLSPRPPADYDPAHPNQSEIERSLTVSRPSGIELTFGNDATPGQAAQFRALSVTSVESYVDWAEVEPEPGRWDWSKWDRQVATLEEARLRWVPFLIAGPAYATPRWFQHGSQSRFYRCLEHGQESRVQSLFNPDLPARVDAFLQAFAARYRDRGVIESVLLGVTGIYGESIYPAGPEGGWTTRLTGPYHNHAGWWAGDDHAIASFRAAMRRRYTSIEALNRAWGTAHGGFDAVVTFLPERAPNDRARVNFVEWYQDAMTQWAVTWVRAARRAFPSTEIYLCTGGDGLPMLGADFTAQAAAIAPERAGIRVTNEGSDYTANFSLTREVATATRLYGTFCGFEPASGVDARGVVARIYNATASGARQLHDYIPNTLGGDPQALAQFRSHIGWLVPRQPRIQAAVYLARESWAVEPRGVSQLQERARVLRDVTDIDFLTRRSVQDGHLAPYRLLVLADAPVLERRSAEAIEEWVKQGGTLIAADRPGIPLGSRLDDLASWRARLFASPDAAALGSLVRPELEGEAPPRWQLNVGSAGDQPWLVGRWHDRESAAEWVDQPHPTMRWSGPGSAILIPVRPGSPHEVRVHLSVRAEAIGQEGVRLRIGRDTLATIRKPGRSTATFTLTPERVGPGNVVRLDIAARVWRPADVDRGSDDQRPLGIAVHRVEVRRVPQPRTQPAEARLRWTIDDAKLAACRRAVGRGTTFYLPGGAAEPHTLSLVAASQLVEPVDGRLDGRYATTTDRGILWLDPGRPSISDQRFDGKEPGSAGSPGARK